MASSIDNAWVCFSDVHTGRTCHETTFGCCKDGKNAALGPNSAGCPGKHDHDNSISRTDIYLLQTFKR